MAKFVDMVDLTIQAGHGGPGSVHFRREKYIPKGGPDGGDGGDGGDVWVRVHEQVYNLDHFDPNRVYKAQNGAPGREQKKSGKKGRDLLLIVPPGAEITDIETGESLFDAGSDSISSIQNPKLLCAGGKGGMGNVHFATSTNQAPRYAQKGTPGQCRRIRINLKLIADIGLVGLPNAGKSTLLRALTNAKPKVADYPFTTLIPQLGTLQIDTSHGPLLLKIADIPGIVEGAHKGSGLGLSFLQHIERVRLLLYLIGLDHPDPLQCFSMLQAELESYHPDLPGKDAIVVFNKWDLVPEKDRTDLRELYVTELSRKTGMAAGQVVFLSARDKLNIGALISLLSSFRRP